MQLSGQLVLGAGAVHDRLAVRSALRDFARSRLREWAERSQQAACRNAMVASTLLTERGHERREVEEYLADALGSTSPPPARPSEVGTASAALG